MNEKFLFLAGAMLLCICVANIFAYEKLGWRRNLIQTEPFFQQIFKVHSLYIVLTMLAMAAACFFAAEELLGAHTILSKGVLGFMTIFWSGRVVLHLFYYDSGVKKENPLWNALFLSVFFYLAVLFGILTFI